MNQQAKFYLSLLAVMGMVVLGWVTLRQKDVPLPPPQTALPGASSPVAPSSNAVPSPLQLPVQLPADQMRQKEVAMGKQIAQLADLTEPQKQELVGKLNAKTEYAKKLQVTNYEPREIRFDLRNDGDRVVRNPVVVAYFLDAAGKRLSRVQAVPKNSFFRGPIVIHPGESFAFIYPAANVPSGWSKQVQLEVTDFEFEDGLSAQEEQTPLSPEVLREVERMRPKTRPPAAPAW